MQLTHLSMGPGCMIPSIVWLTAEDSVRAEEQKPDTQVGYRATPKTAIRESPVPFAHSFLSHKARNHMDKGQCLNRIERIAKSAMSVSSSNPATTFEPARKQKRSEFSSYRHELIVDIFSPTCRSVLQRRFGLIVNFLNLMSGVLIGCHG